MGTQKNGRACCTRRTAWNGGLTEQEQQITGARLLQMLFSAANMRNLQIRELASSLGVSAGYLHQLRTGLKPVPGISRQLIENIRVFLGVPRINVLLAAGIVRHEDFYADSDQMEASLRNAEEFVRSDPMYGPLVPTDFDDHSGNLRMLVIRLYEKANGYRLLSESTALMDSTKGN